MYCPQCAGPNVDGAKFCRACGLKLEAIALALNSASDAPQKSSKERGEPATQEDWVEKRIKGVKDITSGATLLTVSALIGLAMALFLPKQAPWMLIWTVFFGWMACWGAIVTANGIGNLLEAKSRLRLLKSRLKESTLDSTPAELPPARLSPTNLDTPALALSPSLSVTEGTTRELDKHSQD
jgi:hypothetical protein